MMRFRKAFSMSSEQVYLYTFLFFSSWCEFLSIFSWLYLSKLTWIRFYQLKYLLNVVFCFEISLYEVVTKWEITSSHTDVVNTFFPFIRGNSMVLSQCFLFVLVKKLQSSLFKNRHSKYYVIFNKRAESGIHFEIVKIEYILSFFCLFIPFSIQSCKLNVIY